LLAGIWIKIADGCSFLSEVVRNNRLWFEDEKTWYENVHSEQDGVYHCLWFVMPKKLQRLEKVRKFAEEKGIFYLAPYLEDESP
jgi:hypothetical protein